MQWFSWCHPCVRASTFVNNLFLNTVRIRVLYKSIFTYWRKYMGDFQIYVIFIEMSTKDIWHTTLKMFLLRWWGRMTPIIKEWKSSLVISLKIGGPRFQNHSVLKSLIWATGPGSCCLLPILAFVNFILSIHNNHFLSSGIFIFFCQ